MSAALLGYPDEKPQIEASRALRVAMEVIGLLSPVCERIEIAGSLRRQKEFVGDVELVLVPKIEEVTAGLFHEPTGEFRSKQLEYVNELCARGVMHDRPDKNGAISRGMKAQRLAYKGCPVDIFAVTPPAQWGVVFFIRTGSGDWNKRVIVPRCKDGKVLPPGMYLDKGALYAGGREVPDNRPGKSGFMYVGGEVVPCPEEKDFFAAIGLDWVEPCDRIR